MRLCALRNCTVADGSFCGRRDDAAARKVSRGNVRFCVGFSDACKPDSITARSSARRRNLHTLRHAHDIECEAHLVRFDRQQTCPSHNLGYDRNVAFDFRRWRCRLDQPTQQLQARNRRSTEENLICRTLPHFHSYHLTVVAVWPNQGKPV